MQRRNLLGLASALAAVLVISLAGCGSAAGAPFHAQTCVYSAESLSRLTAFEKLAHHHISCAMVFDDAATNWAAWDHPYFIDSINPSYNWARFARAPGDRLIITVSLFPWPPLPSADWRGLGAAGAYNRYARRLASNLIRAGMGHAIIRLAHEANGTWYPDNVGTTPQEWHEWAQFWRQTVVAMRSVPGAHFSFNWCIANGYRAIPFADYYPGNDVVDSIGVDVYDSGVPQGQDRWAYQYSQPGGLAAIARFAQAHHKPLTVPEWGLQPASIGGAGDDPLFVRGMARFMLNSRVAFESYFFATGAAAALLGAPASLRIYLQSIVN